MAQKGSRQGRSQRGLGRCGRHGARLVRLQCGFRSVHGASHPAVYACSIAQWVAGSTGVMPGQTQSRIQGGAEARIQGWRPMRSRRMPMTAGACPLRRRQASFRNCTSRVRCRPFPRLNDRGPGPAGPLHPPVGLRCSGARSVAGARGVRCAPPARGSGCAGRVRLRGPPPVRRGRGCPAPCRCTARRACTMAVRRASSSIVTTARSTGRAWRTPRGSGSVARWSAKVYRAPGSAGSGQERGVSSDHCGAGIGAKGPYHLLAHTASSASAILAPRTVREWK